MIDDDDDDDDDNGFIWLAGAIKTGRTVLNR
jgi:hypothetical protein